MVTVLLPYVSIESGAAAPSFHPNHKSLLCRHLQNLIRRLVALLHNFDCLRSNMNNLADRCAHRNQHFSSFSVRAKTQEVATSCRL